MFIAKTFIITSTLKTAPNRTVRRNNKKIPASTSLKPIKKLYALENPKKVQASPMGDDSP
jgi:hypothetical protein